MNLTQHQLDDRLVNKIHSLTKEKVLSAKEMIPLIVKGRALIVKYSGELFPGFSDKELKCFNLGLLYDIYEDK